MHYDFICIGSVEMMVIHTTITICMGSKL